MRVVIVTFIVLFGSAQLLQWLQHFTFPLPVFILGGAFLAVISNADKRLGVLNPKPSEGEEIPQAPIAPPVQASAQSPRSISFKIQRSETYRD